MKKYLSMIMLASISGHAFAITDADLLHQYLSRLHTLQAQFEQEVLTKKGKVKQRLSGEFILQKPNRFVWQINQPHPQRLISNGKELWIYQPALKQAIKKSIHSTLNKTPIELLSGSSRELSYYFRIDSMKEGDSITFRLRPKDKKIAFHDIQFVFQNNQLKDLKFSDPLGQKVKIHFYQSRENINLSPSTFQFIPPPGTDIVKGNRNKR